MTGTHGSLEKSFREACAAAQGIAGGAADAGQLDLLRDGAGKLPGNVFQLIRAGRATGAGAGRPPGAGNKRNKKLAEMICSRSGDPVLFMSDVYAMPLDQLVEMLRIADGSEEREARLIMIAEQVESLVASVLKKTVIDGSQVEKLSDLVERLADMAKELKSRPGALALGALQVQLQAARATAEYVHGKQPISVHVKGKADMVLLIPGLNAPVLGAGELAQAVEKYGVECIDVEGMRLLPNPDEDEDGDGSDEGGGDDEGGGEGEQ